MTQLTDWLDELLGRLTMYRLLVWCLGAIATVALGLMAVGYLAYSPLAFIASLGAFVGTAYVSNRLFGWLFGLVPHGESAIITGLILALLFSPPTTPAAAASFALVAAIAMASKYVLVVRGRHLFNPAAIGIVIASGAGLAYASWWVATPALLPVTAIVAFLVLYKTRRMQMALVFLAVAICMIMLQAWLTNTGQSLVSALTSWPLIFFAGVMLSEPLTQPPRRYQQCIVAALVGIVMTLSLHIGPLAMTPALALVIGNAVGWYWGTRKAIKLRFVAKTQLSASYYDFTFDSNNLSFLPGQYLELTLPHARADSRGVRRMFSVIGRPGGEQISIGTKIPAQPSSFKRTLMAIKPGQAVYATRIAGDFILPSNTATPLVLIAGGIGVTPYISFLMAAAGKRPVQLLYAVASSQDMAYVDQLRHYDVVVTVVSPDEALLPDPSWRHITAPFITKDIVADCISDEVSPQVYISGPPGMVNSTKRIIKGLGLPYKTDHFAGY